MEGVVFLIGRPNVQRARKVLIGELDSIVDDADEALENLETAAHALSW